MATVRITISIDATLHRQAKMAAARQGKTLSKLVEETLRNGLRANDDYRPPLVLEGSGKCLIDLTKNSEI